MKILIEGDGFRYEREIAPSTAVQVVALVVDRERRAAEDTADHAVEPKVKVP